MHGAKRRAQWKAAVIREARLVLSHGGKDPVRLVRLSLDPKRSPTGLKAQHRHLKQVWRRLRERIRRKISRPLEFITVVEPHKDGRPHLHSMVDAYLDKAWLNDASLAVGGGSTRIEAVKSLERVDRYLSKYLSKEMLSQPMPKGMRRVMTSRGVKLRLSRARTGRVSAWKVVRT